MTWLVFVVRLVVGGILIAAGALKITQTAAFAEAIAGFRLLPPSVVLPLAMALPPLEIIFGLYLVAGLFTRIAAGVVCAMFLAYGAAIASAVVRHIPANCGCFGPGERATADWPHVGFLALLAGAAFAIVRYAPGAFAVDSRLARAAIKEG